MSAAHDDASIAAAIARHARASRRIRLDVLALRGDPRLAKAIETSARARPGVGAMVGGSAALHLLAVASAPARALFRITGTTPLALATAGAAMSVPLYVAWQRHASREITRFGPSKEKPR